MTYDTPHTTNHTPHAAPQGYIIVIDLGLAKRVPYTKQTDAGEVVHDMTYTLCGTFE